ncbi:deoxyhypusine synthase-like [Mya arenaria]|uniref:deoxyhypusine synthase-like n=1 Tax=Mya arenaria TaxID=6604 RepID=UPI0022E4BB99|nr:deoxyhypusine synthase-like [Mya arenaria]XP_052766433.1 deoxyhypusine synthase-like [Mya arenaria]XP_052766434.1 deoxyhypusine synthase-like [Mya arenaria]
MQEESVEIIPSLAVLKKSESMPDGTPTVRGYDFSEGVDYHKLLQSYATSGFQAQNFGRAVEEINRMIHCKLLPIDDKNVKELIGHPTGRSRTNCSIFLSYTSNMISSGVRETIRYLVQNNMVDCLVTTAGGIEEDFMKCFAPTYVGDFALKGHSLREKGINRVGNLLIPNDNYEKFDAWIIPILNTMLQEQKEKGTLWTPSRVIDRLGREINNPDSVYYWAHRNNIPVFCPAITDGALGDAIYCHSVKNPGLVIDLVHDIRAIGSVSINAVHSGMIILGGGVIKHHTCNANLARNGADFAVYLNTAQEFDGSDSGANPDEAVSWGKIKSNAKPVKICAEASLVFPLLVAETFSQRQNEFTAPTPRTETTAQDDTGKNCEMF